MKKTLITLAVLGLAAVGCDPYKDPPSGTPAVISAVITGRNAGLEDLVFGWDPNYVGPYNGTLSGDTWTNFLNGDETTPAADRHGPTRSPSAATYGRILVFTTNRLLDGASVEQTPNSCLPVTSANWTFTGTGPTALATAFPTGSWYTCYYPSSPTDTIGASVYVYYAGTPAAAPGPSTAAIPIRAGRMVVGDYVISGTVKTDSGQDLALKAQFTVIEPVIP
ncbi:MAG: hypothetical protein QM704_06945 [Anaeromyxobacteraceae bacterium]